MSHEHHDRPEPFWRSRAGLALLGFGAVAGFFLFTKHRAHALGVLPFLLVALCPLLHVFGHGGHRHGRGPKEKP